MGAFFVNKVLSLLKILFDMTNKDKEEKGKVGKTEPTQPTNNKEVGKIEPTNNEEGNGSDGNENSPSNEKDIFFNNIKTKYPDYTDDDVYKHANTSYGKLKADNQSMEKAVDTLLEAMEKEPLMSRLVQMLIKYPNKPSYALKVFSKEDLEEALNSYDNALDDDEANASLSEYNAKKKADQDYSEMFENNTKATQAYIQEVADEKGVDVETIVQVLQEYALPILEGKFSKELITTLVDGKDFDKKVQQVADESFKQGELEGKNAKIENKKLEKQQTDGTVPPPSSGSIPIKPKSKIPRMFDFEERPKF